MSTATEAPELDVIVSAKVSHATRDELERRAKAADRSLSAEIRRALQAHVRQDDDEEASA